MSAAAAQRFVVVLNDGTILGTGSRVPFTERSAWHCEGWYKKFYPELGAKIVEIAPRLTSKDLEEDNG